MDWTIFLFLPTGSIYSLTDYMYFVDLLTIPFFFSSSLHYFSPPPLSLSKQMSTINLWNPSPSKKKKISHTM